MNLDQQYSKYFGTGNNSPKAYQKPQLYKQFNRNE